MLEGPRRREPRARGAEDRSDTHAPRKTEAIGHRIIAADIEPRARIGRELAAQRPLGLDQRGDAEALGGIEQAVGPVDADLASQAENGIEIADTLAALEVVILLARRD